MARTFLIIDTSHMLYRTRYATKGDIWTQTGLSLHIMLNSIKKCWQLFDADHVIFALDGRSWRRAIYEPYKKNRDVNRLGKSLDEVEADQIFNDGVNSFISFVQEKTNCTILQNEICEADDLIARFVQTHPDDNHVVISGDTDFIQLLAPNVKIYDGVKNVIIRDDGVFNEKGHPVHFQILSSAKIKVLKEAKAGEEVDVPDDWVRWHLFLKIVRGDTSDNIFSACPRAQIKTIRKAFEDRDDQGYDWHTFMMTRWEDHNDESHRVKDVYARNEQLIDLTLQPDTIKEVMDETIEKATEPKENKQVGLYFLRFAGKYDLKKIAEHPNDFVEFLASQYKS